MPVGSPLAHRDSGKSTQVQVSRGAVMGSGPGGPASIVAPASVGVLASCPVPASVVAPPSLNVPAGHSVQREWPGSTTAPSHLVHAS